jgi:hypothetical protein
VTMEDEQGSQYMSVTVCSTAQQSSQNLRYIPFYYFKLCLFQFSSISQISCLLFMVKQCEFEEFLDDTIPPNYEGPMHHYETDEYMRLQC